MRVQLRADDLVFAGLGLAALRPCMFEIYVTDSAYCATGMRDRCTDAFFFGLWRDLSRGVLDF